MLSWLKSKWTGIGVLIAALVCTHWWTYRLGVRVEHDRMAAITEQLFNNDQEEALRQRVEFLRILSKHPPTFDVKDIKSYCLMTLAISESLEKVAIADARKAGDDPKADHLQRKVDEARQIVSRLMGEGGK